MIESISACPLLCSKHRAAPLLAERDQYLQHLLAIGMHPSRVRCTATFLIHIVRILELTTLREVSSTEIERASQRWIEYRSLDQKNAGAATSVTTKNFSRIARGWLRFHRLLDQGTPPGPFDRELENFRSALPSHQGLSPATVAGYVSRAHCFLDWLARSELDLANVSLITIDRFLTEKRESGWKLGTLATQCLALRAFFKYAEERDWCQRGLARGVKGPRRPKYADAPKGPTWAQVRQLIRSANGDSPRDLRARAMLLLYSVYALRNSEVAQLRLEDFDWRNETFTVRRAKKGGIQHYPIQYEVGEAILAYLQKGRPRCVCRNVFVTLQVPYRPISPAGMWVIVKKRRYGNETGHSDAGPHALRHACATQLLKKGSSLKEIADFLGHHDTRSVGIYAKYDQRSLREVAAFSLRCIR